LADVQPQNNSKQVDDDELWHDLIYFHNVSFQICPDFKSKGSDRSTPGGLCLGREPPPGFHQFGQIKLCGANPNMCVGKNGDERFAPFLQL
jgi:hypothetical protein